jgi:phosphomethylpyrimidine synthase
MCGPHFCSMRITEDVRKYAAEQRRECGRSLKCGMEGKSKEFAEKGAEVTPRRNFPVFLLTTISGE